MGRPTKVGTNGTQSILTPSFSTAAKVIRREIVFVDAAVPDYQTLVDDLLSAAAAGRQFEVVMLSGGDDGVEQMTRTLGELQDLDAVHIISHGTGGAAKLGDSWLTLGSLDEYSYAIKGWSNALADGADLLVYGCHLAAGSDGQALIEALSELSGADVAASDDGTGNAGLGGDWDLEYHSGNVELALPSAWEAQENWSGLLVQPVITAREAVDDDCNGQIDHIKIITDQNLDDDFSGLTLTVTGYMLDASPYLTNIGLDGNNDNVFYVKLVEGVTPDTDGTPAVTVTANVTLSEFGGSNNIAVDTTMVIEAENFNTNVSLDTPALHLWTFQTTPTFGGFSGTGYMMALPDDGANCGSNHTTCGAEMTYNFVLATAGIYAVTFRWEADSAGDDSVQWGADGVRAAKNINPDGVFGSWV